jgi:hypothetical protein
MTPDTVARRGQPPAIQKGAFSVYRFFDLGEEIDLAIAHSCLAASSLADERAAARAHEASSIQVAQQPVRAKLGPAVLQVGDRTEPGLMRATIYDLGAVALAVEVVLPQPIDWGTVADLFKTAPELPESIDAQFTSALDLLEQKLKPAVVRPRRSAIVEDYGILVVERVADGASVQDLKEHPLVWAAVLGERRALSLDAAGLVTAMSYYPEDLALLSWSGALLIDPDPVAAGTATDLIEFGQVELLLMRVYDAGLDEQLPGMYRLISRPRGQLILPLVRGYGGALHETQRLIADVTEVTERVDNALKVTDDVYWNRLYTALVTVLRIDVWRQGVEHKLSLLRQTYGLLQDEASAERALALELTIILLIALEIVLALVKR